MQYLPLFLLFMAALIAAWFYLQRAKARDTGEATTTTGLTPSSADEAAVVAAPERAD